MFRTLKKNSVMVYDAWVAYHIGGEFDFKGFCIALSPQQTNCLRASKIVRIYEDNVYVLLCGFWKFFTTFGVCRSYKKNPTDLNA